MCKFRHTLLAVLFPLVACGEQITPKVLPGIVMVAKVSGRVFLEFNGQAYRAKKKTKAVQGVVINAHPGSSILMLMANGSTLHLKGPSKLKIERFLVESYALPPIPWAKIKEEPSSSDTLLRLDYGDAILETMVLHEKSSLIVTTPFGNVRPIPNDYGFKTLFRVRYSEEYPMVATWEGLVELESPDHDEPRIVARDEQLFVHPEKGLLLAPGLTASNVRIFEQTMAELKTAQTRFRIK